MNRLFHMRNDRDRDYGGGRAGERIERITTGF
jgi:hypothetical protein